MGGSMRKIIGIILASISLMITCAFTSGGLHDTVSKDSTRPTVVLSITQPTGKNGWYNAPVFVKVIAYDGGSGLSAAQVSLGGTTWYNGALMIRNDGSFLVVGKAVDRAGNVATTSVVVKVDMTPPDVQFTYPKPDGKKGFYVDEVPFVLTGTDALSGVVFSKLIVEGKSIASDLSNIDVLEVYSDEKVREYQQLIQGKNISTKTVRVLINESGSYTISGYIEDEAGNQTPVSKLITVDMDAPQVSIASPKEYKDNIELIGSVSDFDSGTSRVLVDYGLGWMRAELDDENWSIVWPVGELVEGKYPIKAKAIDVAGNETVTNYSATVLNTVWPFITMSAILIAVALFFELDPRAKEWTLLTAEIKRHKHLYTNGLYLGIEEDFKND